MKFEKTPIYRKYKQPVPRHLKLITLLVAVLIPYQTLSDPEVKTEPYEQEFLITAYYSPLPGQCCYVVGGLEADKVLNGQGIQATDGTKVYPGMIAAPPSYPFGTKVSLPGIGTFTVHDRGGAITELESGKHRLDIWVGHGEEGLARALAFGLVGVTGTVYPTASSQPETQVDLAALPAPIDELRQYFVEKDNFLSVRPKEGDTGLSVYVVQDYLKEIGYLKHRPTGFYGPETSRAYKAFIRDFGVKAPQTALSKESAAYLLGARKRLGAREPFAEYVDPDASKKAVSEAQRILRFLGYYKGKTNGVYDENLFASILKFQKEYSIVGSSEQLGAGRIGPKTSDALRAAWNRAIVGRHAAKYMDLHALDEHMEKRGQRIAKFLGEGYSGHQVRLLQNELAALGFFPEEEANGHFGEMTRDAVLAYQLDRNIISSKADTGAGYVGPATLQSLRKDHRSILYGLVRAEGWRAL